jgi:hypothetical protein
MTKVIATPDVQAWLAGIKGPAEIQGTDGNVLGYYNPSMETEAELYERVKKLFDPAEIERIASTEKGQGRPLAELWAELKAKESA